MDLRNPKYNPFFINDYYLFEYGAIPENIRNQYRLKVLKRKGSVDQKNIKLIEYYENTIKAGSFDEIKEVIEEFLQHQRKLIYLLELAKNLDINSIRIPISLTPYIKLKLGDTFNFIIAHNNRHRLQIENILDFNKMVLRHEAMQAM